MSVDSLASGWAKALGVDRKHFNLFFERMMDGFAYHKIIVDREGKPVDYVFLEVNDAFERMTGLKKEKIIGKKVTEVLKGIEKDPADWIGRYGKVALNCEPAQFENYAQPLDKWYSVSAYCPEKGYFVALFEDITERKKAEDGLRKAKNDWERTFDSVPDFIAILDNDYKIMRVNLAMAQQLGVTPEKAVGLLCYECVHGTNSPIDSCPHQQLIQDGKQHIAEVHEPRLGGDFIVTDTPLRDENGKIIGSVHVARNITERKKAEEAQKTTLDRFYTSLSNMNGAILLVSADGAVEFGNQSFCDFFNLKESPSELKGLTSGAIIEKIKSSYLHPDKQVTRISEIVTAGKQVVGEEVALTGGRTCLRDFIPLHKTKGSFSRLWHHMDITKQKQAEEAVAQSEKRYRELFSSMNDMFVAVKTSYFEFDLIFDEKGKPVDVIYLEVNSSGEKLIGKNKQEIIGKSRKQLFGDVHDEFPEKFGSVLKTGKPTHFETYGAGLSKYYDVYAWKIPENHVAVILTDITERKKTQEALNRSEARFRTAMDNMLEGCQIIGFDWRYIYINDAAKRHNRRPKEPMLGKLYMDMWPGIESTVVFAMIKRCLEKRMPTSMENEFAFPDGTVGWFDLKIEPVPEGAFILSSNITDRKKAEQALRESEQRWATTVSSIGDAIIATDTLGKVTFLNAVAENVTGWTLKEAMGKDISHVFNIINEASREKVENPVTKVLEQGCIVGLANHTMLIRKNGVEVPIDDSGAPIKTSDGKTIGVVLVFRDITERKKAEEALKQSEQRYSSLFNSLPEGFCLVEIVHDKNNVAIDLRFLEINDAYAKLVNRSREQIIGKTTRESFGAVESYWYQLYDKVAKTGEFVHYENYVQLHNRYYEVYAWRADAANHVAILNSNITERKKAEEAIARQAELIDLSPDAIIVRKLEGTITLWSKGAEKLYGWTKQEAIGKSTHTLFQTKFNQPFQGIIEELKRTMRWSGELIHKTKSGKEVTVQSWWLAEKTEHGEITSILESNVDLTERKDAEKEITRLATFPTLNPNPILEVNFEGKVTYANPATKTLFPTLEEEGLDHVFLSDWENITETFKSKSTKTFDRELNINGHWYHQQFYIVEETNNIRAYITDVDELKQAEEIRAIAQVKLEENAILLEEYANQMEELANQRAAQLKDAERLAGIGQTAGMVGHDIRNPLQAITSDMYLITEELKSMRDGESKKAILESIESISENLTYINKIVSDLQDYTRPLKPNIQDVNLSELIQSTLITINVPKRIELTTDIKENSKAIKTDVAYLRRILTNLFTNAVQAMPNEGELTVKANRRKQTIEITVEDTGVGIPQEVKTKLFTPLFTTKSKGQGLGLAVVKRLVEALGGTISFESEENRGTKFTVEIPQPK